MSRGFCKKVREIGKIVDKRGLAWYNESAPRRLPNRADNDAAERQTARQVGQRIVGVAWECRSRRPQGKRAIRARKPVLPLFGFESQLPQKQSLDAIVNENSLLNELSIHYQKMPRPAPLELAPRAIPRAPCRREDTARERFEPFFDDRIRQDPPKAAPRSIPPPFARYRSGADEISAWKRF